MNRLNHPAEQLLQITTRMLNDLTLLVRHLQAFMKILIEWSTFKLEGARALKFHFGFKFPRDTDGDLFLVPYKESDNIVEVCELTAAKRPKQACIHLQFLKVSKPEMNSSELIRMRCSGNIHLLSEQLHGSSRLDNFAYILAY
jgi:hypothetical protein